MKNRSTEASDKHQKSKQKTLYIVGGTILLIIIIAIAANSGGSKSPAIDTSSSVNNSSGSSTDQSAHTSSNSPQATTQQPTQRNVQGTAVTLGAGDFAVGTDINPGIYDVTAGSGQSGNFIVDGTDGTAVYNEVIGDPSQGQVSKIRVVFTKSEQVHISGMDSVIFTPTASPLVTTHGSVSLYAGTFEVGEDIGPGRYVVTPASGESGNFIVDDTNGHNKINEILGNDSSSGQVSSYTATLNNGDIITLSGIDSVLFASSN